MQYGDGSQVGETQSLDVYYDDEEVYDDDGVDFDPSKEQDSDSQGTVITQYDIDNPPPMNLQKPDVEESNSHRRPQLCHSKIWRRR